jgi:hypothetical protein
MNKYTGVGQNNGNTDIEEQNLFVLAALKELQLATLNVLFPFLYIL